LLRSLLTAAGRSAGIRAIEALAATVPLFLVLFASTYFMMSTFGTGNFSQEDLSRTDSLYFTVTVFSTVGFGDISPTSESARLVVSGQMILDLFILGFGVNAIVSAAKMGVSGSPSPAPLTNSPSVCLMLAKLRGPWVTMYG
jgi:hypothetical protein